MLKGYMVKESLAIPGLEPDLLAAQVEQSAICTAHRPGAQNAPPRCTKRTAPVHKSTAHRPGAQKRLRLALQSLVNFKVFSYLTHMQNI